MKGESVAYPMFEDNGLTVDQRYKEIQKQGLLKVKLPYGEPCWLATRYADVRTVYGDRRFGRVLGLNRDAPGVWPGALAKNPTLLLNMDPPEHTRLRRLTAETFSPRRIERMAGWVQRLVDELLDDMVAQGKPADFVSVFSSNLPVRVLLRILGVPETEAGEFRSMVDRATALDADAQTREEAQQRTVAHIKGLIAERRARHRDDLLSELVDARDQGDRLSEEELISLCMALWHGGFKTTLWQLGKTVYTLLIHPQHWQELLANQELLPAALEELWRWIPSFKYGVPFVRWASEDVELSDGTLVRAGEPVLPEITVANRDESAFPHGWELDFHRVDPPTHLTLAYGPHYCMGAHLAHLQIKLTVQTLLRRFPTLALAVPQNQVLWSKSTFMRSIEALPLTW
jgi:cytochrome P450 RapN